MKSRIHIDVDEDNQPIITINYVASEDVKDKLVKKFMETFGSQSSWAEFKFTSAVDNSDCRIRPIKPQDLEAHIDIIKSSIGSDLIK